MNRKIIITAMAVFFALIAFHSVSGELPADYGILTQITGTNFLPSTIHAGDVVNLAIDIKNRGGTISIVDLNAVLDIGDQFEPIALSDETNIIIPGATRTLVFKFNVKDDTLTGYYPALLTMTYLRGDNTIKETQSITIPVTRTERNIEVTVSPSVINPGNQTQLAFTIKNTAKTPISNLSFSWYERSNLILPIGSDNKRFIPILNANTAETVSYTVAADPNITTGVYSFDVNMTFTDVNGSRSQGSRLGIIVGGSTDFEVSAEMLSTGQLSTSIANIGSNNAAAVVIRIPQQPGIIVSGSNTAIIGSLNKGDFTLANFDVQQAGSSVDQNITGAAGAFRNRQFPSGASDMNNNAFAQARTANEVTIEIDYTDTTGTRQTVRKTIQLSSSSSSGNVLSVASGLRQRENGYSFLAWLLPLLLVAGAIGFREYKAKTIGWKQLAKPVAAIIILFLAAVFLLNSELIATIAAAIASVALLAWFFRKNQGK
ncbi:MAG: COG1361 S-layer family protein [Candidatus Diapherotrites archaeon]